MNKSLFEKLKKFVPRQRKNYIDITIPVVMNLNGSLLELRVKENENSYEILCQTNLFLEANAGGSQKFYYDIFEKHDKNYHYDMKIRNEKIYKEYTKDYNIIVAISEFIKFFVMFDDFFINNSVIGNEEKFI